VLGSPVDTGMEKPITSRKAKCYRQTEAEETLSVFVQFRCNLEVSGDDHGNETLLPQFNF